MEKDYQQAPTSSQVVKPRPPHVPMYSNLIRREKVVDQHRPGVPGRRDDIIFVFAVRPANSNLLCGVTPGTKCLVEV